LAKAFALRLVRPQYGGTRPTDRPGGRADIQGLRALAVLLVIGDHLVGRPRGGFIGVDIFFVISGYLITGLLLREHQRTGHISFVGFYRRRVKRILPAAVVVALATVATTNLVFGGTFAGRTEVDAEWALLFAANFRFAATGTDYFASSTTPSPLQHYWSLSVEEQFYFVWPWLILLVLVVLSRKGRARHGRLVISTLMALAITTSFLWAVVETRHDPTSAYFSTYSRMWELGAGALLAVLSPAFARIGPMTAAVLGWCGLVAIAISALVIHAGPTFPAPEAALPVAAAVVVIAAGIGRGGTQRWLWPLTNPLSRWVGDISYSLYLWHFPVIIILGSFMPNGYRYYACAALSLLLLATASYYGLEDPVRRSAWLERSRPRDKRHRVPRAVSYASFAGALVVLAAGVVSVPSPTAPNLALIRADVELPGTPPDSPLDAWRAKVAAAIAQTHWPDGLDPDPDDLSRTAPGVVVDEWAKDGCLGLEVGSHGTPIQNAEHCMYGSATAPHTAVLVGDSTAISLAPALREALGSSWRLQILTTKLCPLGTGGVKNPDGSPFPECADFRQAALGEISRMHPELVVATSLPGSMSSYASTDAELRGVTSYLTELARSSKHALVISSPPGAPPISTCKKLLEGPWSCLGPVTDAAATSWRMTLKTAAADAGVPWIDSEDWMCIDGVCPPFIDGTIAYFDWWHYTGTMSAKLGPVLAVEIHEKVPHLISREQGQDRGAGTVAASLVATY
jgi:peptidoglycan/LPS O-acetylase OafA/YrhL